MSGAQLVRYDAMVRAIDKAHRVDEVMKLRNIALQLEWAARCAMNTDAERKATEIRLRNERRAGELLAKMERSTKAAAGAKGNKAQGKNAPATVAAASPYREALKSNRLNERTAERWQELAGVPKQQFEDALRDPEKKPTTTGILAASKPVPKMDDDALWVWGRLRDFERMEIAKRDAPHLFKAMTDTMQDDLRRILPVAIDFLNQLSEATDGKE